MKVFVSLDADARPIAFYPLDGHWTEETVPEGLTEISEEDWRDCLSHPGQRAFRDGELVVIELPPPLPPPIANISDRQFAQALALAGTITEAEALAWAARGELPQAMEDALDRIPDADGQRFGARMMLAAATTYERRHPLSEQLGALLGYDAPALDALWTKAAAL